MLLFLEDNSWSAALFLSLLQVGFFLSFVPLFGSRFVAPRVRISIIIVLMSIIFPSRLEFLISSNCAEYSLLDHVLRACVQGAVQGFILRKLIYVAEISASILAQISSVSFLMGQNPSGDQGTALSQLLAFSLLSIVAYADFHIYAISFILAPVSLCLLSDELIPPGFLIPIFSDIIESAFYFTYSFLTLGIIYYLCLGLINRSLPQLMVAFIGAPFLILLSFSAFATFLPMLIEELVAQQVIGGDVE